MASVHVRTAALEIKIESEQGIEALLEQAAKIAERLGSMSGSQPALASEPQTKPAADAEAAAVSDVSINTIVSKLGAQTGREILKAAAAHLSIVDGKATFSRADWGERARQAHGWKKFFSSNQAKDIKRMIDAGDILEKTGNMYALPSKTIDEVKGKLKGE